jgi:integrase
MKTHDVRVWDVREKTPKREMKNGKKKPPTYQVRWVVAGREHPRTFATKPLANAFRAKLIVATHNGEAFDTESGLPDSMIERAPVTSVTWLELTAKYVDAKWPSLAAKSRATTVESLSALLPGLCTELAGRPDTRTLRWALCRWYLPPAMRKKDAEKPPPEVAAVLDWLRRASLPVAAVGDANVALAGLNAILTRLDGKAYAPNVIRRRRAVLTNLVKFAIVLKELPGDPFSNLPWTPPKRSKQVDRRRVPNPRQVVEILTAVSYVGPWKGRRLPRGLRYVAFFACMYYAYLRPEEVTGLRTDDCRLPQKGWGELTLAGARPNSEKQWTDSGETHDEKGLKHRAEDDTRHVPIPPVLVRMLREHIATFGTAKDGRVFANERGGLINKSVYATVWRTARPFALNEKQVKSALAKVPYDLRHAGISLGLRSTRDPALVAERAGHGVNMLMTRYAWALDEKDDAANAAIEKALEGRDT